MLVSLTHSTLQLTDSCDWKYTHACGASPARRIGMTLEQHQLMYSFASRTAELNA